MAYTIAPIQTERSKSCLVVQVSMENFCIWKNILTKFGMDYRVRQRYNLCGNYSDRTPTS